MFFLSLLFMGFSCEKTKNSGIPPTIEIFSDSNYIGNTATVVPGTLMSFIIHGREGSEKLTNFYIEVSNSDEKQTRYFDTALYSQQFVWKGSFYKSSDPDEEWSFVVSDRRGGSNRKSIRILSGANSDWNPVSEIENIHLGAQNNSEYGGFYSFLLNEIFTIEKAQQNQEMIDMLYYYGDDGFTIASPGANLEDAVFAAELNPGYWEVRNTTRYIPIQISENDFYIAENDSIILANYVNEDAKKKARKLKQGDIFVFRNQVNRFGMFLIKSINGGDSGDILIDIKIQNIDEE